MQRFVWDLHYLAPLALHYDFPISAIYKDTPFVPQGPLAMPDQYLVRLTVNGRSFEQPLVVNIDPRVKTPAEGLRQQFELSMQAYQGMNETKQILDQLQRLRAQIKARNTPEIQKPVADSLSSLDRKLAALEGVGGRGPNGGAANGEMNLVRLNGAFGGLLDVFQDADAAPTTQAVAAISDMQKSLAALRQQWNDLADKELKSVNDQLSSSQLPAITTR
jgi:ABC-type phosphate transport system auxiliary subunit